MYAVVMAGGGGTRLWPLSRDRKPKPFLPLLEDGGCLLAATIGRSGPDSSGPRRLRRHGHAPRSLVREAVPALPLANIIGEPLGRNTAAAVALAAEAIDRPTTRSWSSFRPTRPCGTMTPTSRPCGRLPSGRRAATWSRSASSPPSPPTGYGYVVADGPPQAHAGRPTFRVARFEEKPTPQRAAELIASGAAYWNAGIFVWRRDVLRSGLARHAPDILEPIRERLAAERW